MSPCPKSDVRIVIIDDNAGSVELMASALAGEGVDIVTSTDPEEGLDLIFQTSSPDRSHRSCNAQADGHADSGTNHGIRSGH